MHQRIIKLGYLLKVATLKWYDRDPFREGAIIAYNAIFALPGLLVVVITLTGYFFGGEEVSSHLHAQIAEALGINTADQIQEMVNMSMRLGDHLWRWHHHHRGNRSLCGTSKITEYYLGSKSDNIQVGYLDGD